MTGRQIVGRILLAVLVVGLLAAAGYAIYRLGFNAGIASATPLDDIRGFTFERLPRFEPPDRPHLRVLESMPRGVRGYAYRAGLIGLWSLSPWLIIGLLLLAGGGILATLVVLFRWAFGPASTQAGPEVESGEKY